MTDEQLFRDYQATRSDTAFTELFKRHQKPLFRWLSSRTQAATADDITQETWRRMASYQAPVLVFQAWLFSIAYQQLASFIARKKIKTMDQTEVAYTITAPNQVTTLECLDDRQEILDALDTLPWEQFMLVVAVYYEDSSATQMGRVLGLPRSTASHQLKMGIDRLQKVLGRE